MKIPQKMRCTGRRKKPYLFALVVIASAIFIVIHFTRDRKEDDNRFELSSSSNSHESFLNVAIWEDICGNEMQSLKEFPLFPSGPSKRLRTSSLQLHFKQEFENFGLRIYGFLSPKESGDYNIFLASSGTSELWISSNSKPENSKLIVNLTAGRNWKYSNDERSAISMIVGRRYYLEILHKEGHHDKWRTRVNQLHVTWRCSSWREDKPREIPADVFLPFEIDLNIFDHVRTLDRDTGVVFPIHIQRHDPRFVNEEVQHRAEMYLLPFINERDAQNLFPSCGYNPSYLVKGPLERYQSTWEMHYTSIFPFDYSDVLEKKPEGEGDFLNLGNDELDENTAKAVVFQVWAQIQKKHPG